MSEPRRNEVTVISGYELARPRRDATVLRLAPAATTFISVPLTPARAARLADFCARRGIDPQAMVIDLLDDVLFDKAGA